MNWLAHLYLSERSAEFRLGNLLPDLAGPLDLATLPHATVQGIACHYRIDRFTDCHPSVRRSIARFRPPFKRFGGIIVDVLYDHFLSVDWQRYADGSLGKFVDDVHAGFDSVRPIVSPSVFEHLDRIRCTNLLGSYETIGGVREALQRIGYRFRKPVNLATAMVDVTRSYNAFHDDFATFFPELREHVATLLETDNIQCVNAS